MEIKIIKMKKIIISAFMLSAVLISCSDNGSKTEAKDAVAVEVIKTETTQKFAMVAEESHVDWRASHLAGVEPRFGKLMLKGAEISTTDNVITNAQVVMDMNNFTVENFEDQESIDKFSAHIKGDDFFKVATYPVSTFELATIEPQEGDYNSKIGGNLTILGVTKSISFNANVLVSDASVSVKSEDFVVNRSDWGLTYNAEGTEGVPTDYLISNDMGFTIDVTVKK
ncbi:MAG: polyisoprenoid-binding protein YceI [Salibacteraceae bacterium]|jgi:polyisoprenoid-binding protein YceI